MCSAMSAAPALRPRQPTAKLAAPRQSLTADVDATERGRTDWRIAHKAPANSDFQAVSKTVIRR
jgi:hypothetical protein